MKQSYLRWNLLLLIAALFSACGSPTVPAKVAAPPTSIASPTARPPVRMPTATEPETAPTATLPGLPTPAPSPTAGVISGEWVPRLNQPAGVQLSLPADWRPNGRITEYAGPGGRLTLMPYPFPDPDLATLCTTPSAEAAVWAGGADKLALATVGGRQICLVSAGPAAPANRALVAYPAPRNLQTGVLIGRGTYTYLWVWVEPPELFEAVIAGLEFPAEPSAAAFIRGVRDVFDVSYIFIDQIDTAAWEAEALAAVGPAGRVEAAYAQVQRLFAEIAEQVGDRHGAIVTPERAMASTGQTRTVGVTFDDDYVVMLVHPAGPGAQAGFQIGDQLLTVNGLPVTDPQAFAAAPYTVELDRAGQRLVLTVAPVPLDPYLPPLSRRLTDRIAYLETFGYNTFDADAMRRYAQAVHDALAALDGPDTCWVLDLRRNRGGSKHAILGGIGPLAGNGNLFFSRDRTGLDQANSYLDGQVTGNTLPRFAMRPANPYQRLSPEVRLALLVSRETASGGELSAMILASQPEVTARIFGEPTQGLTTDVGISELYDYGQLYMPVTVWVDLNGRMYPRGIIPDEAMPVAFNTAYGTDADPLLQAARDWLATEQDCSP